MPVSSHCRRTRWGCWRRTGRYFYRLQDAAHAALLDVDHPAAFSGRWRPRRRRRCGSIRPGRAASSGAPAGGSAGRCRGRERGCSIMVSLNSSRRARWSASASVAVAVGVGHQRQFREAPGAPPRPIPSLAVLDLHLDAVVAAAVSLHFFQQLGGRFLDADGDARHDAPGRETQQGVQGQALAASRSSRSFPERPWPSRCAHPAPSAEQAGQESSRLQFRQQKSFMMNRAETVVFRMHNRVRVGHAFAPGDDAFVLQPDQQRFLQLRRQRWCRTGQ